MDGRVDFDDAVSIRRQKVQQGRRTKTAMKRGRSDKGRSKPSRRRAVQLSVNAESVLELLGRKGRPVFTLHDLQLRLRARGSLLRRLQQILKELVARGEIEVSDGGYRVPRRDGLIEGRIVLAAGGSAAPMHCVETTQGVRWRLDEVSRARLGDRVLILPKPLEPERGEDRVATIVHVEPRERDYWLGIVSRETSSAFLIPYRDDEEWGISIPLSELAGARDGDVVIAEPLSAAGKRDRGLGPQARVIEVLGRPGEPEPDFQAVVWHYRLPVEFSKESIGEAMAYGSSLDPSETARRMDLRHLPFTTIDPETARDHDDAICTESVSEGKTRLWVAIADVSHYVQPASSLDREAFVRGNSVYFPDRAIPMLPAHLSGDLCSLRPDTDRLALAVELVIDTRDGKVLSRHFHEVVIRSRAFLTYEQAADVMEEKSDGGIESQDIREQLRSLAKISKVLLERRLRAGSVDLEIPEAKLKLDANRMPCDVVKAERRISHRAVEEAMLAANRAVATVLDTAKCPAIYRVHDAPELDLVDDFRDLLETFGLSEKQRGEPVTSMEFAEAVRRVKGRPEATLINTVALRSMKQACYEAKNRGHFALGFSSYTHFTSPIRRYADLVVHRALKDWLRHGEASPRRTEREDPQGRVFTAARAVDMPGIAARVSMRERVAQNAEREMLELKKCVFMKPFVGEEFTGAVTGVAKHGLYVTLDRYFVEGLVHISDLPGFWNFDETQFALVAQRSKRRIEIGERVRIHVDRVDLLRGWINFSLVEDEPGEGEMRPKASNRRPASSQHRRGRTGGRRGR